MLSAHASEMEEGDGGVEVRGREDARVRGEVGIRRGTLFGNPFVMRDEGERDGVCAAYADLISGGEAVHVLARRWAVGGRALSVHAPSARTSPQSRRAALERLVRSVREGKKVRLRCGCPRGKSCHGRVIAAYAERLARAPA